MRESPRPKNDDLSVVIPAYNGRDEILSCLRSVRQFTSARTIVVDNDSNDGTVDAVRASGLADNVITMPRNAGFGAACNVGARSVTSEFVLFLNQDARLSSTLDNALALFSERDDVGVIGAQMLDQRGAYRRSVFKFPSAASLALKRFSYARGQFVSGPFDQRSYVVDYVEGSFLLVRLNIWRELKGMDEAYFMYGEERDFCFRARERGYRTLFVPSVTYVHEGGYSPARTPWIIEGQRRFIDAHVKAPLSSFYRFVLRGKTGVRLIWTRFQRRMRPASAMRDQHAGWALAAWRCSGRRP